MPRTKISIAFVLGLCAYGCAGAPPKQPSEENNFSNTPSATRTDASPAETAVPVEQPPPTQSGGLNEEQKKQMEIALRRGGEKAAQCPQATGNEDVPRGDGQVKVVFDGQKGRVTEVTVGPPWAGTAIESCIKRSFLNEIVLPFDGEPLEVPYSIKVPPKAAAATPAKSKK